MILHKSGLSQSESRSSGPSSWRLKSLVAVVALQRGSVARVGVAKGCIILAQPFANHGGNASHHLPPILHSTISHILCKRADTLAYAFAGPQQLPTSTAALSSISSRLT